jgi:hypothetical protein
MKSYAATFTDEQIDKPHQSPDGPLIGRGSRRPSIVLRRRGI